MLFFLTGDVQTGKTRWLTRMLDNLQARGVRVGGVLAPGIWEVHAQPDCSIAYEKLGIDNVLLPQGTRIAFARRRDLAQRDGTYDEGSQAAQMRLAWAIDDAAIDRVNAHLAKLAAQSAEGSAADHANAAAQASGGLLVIDELGRLELLRGQGLTAALDLLDAGATAAYPHALVIVRADLLDAAHERFATAPWGEMQVINPNPDAEQALYSLFL